jgi:Dyp-type peroxidase family
MTGLEKTDIQGLVFSGYPKNPFAFYVLLEIVEPRRARAWLRRLADDVTTGEPPCYGTTTNVALTAGGLRALGMPETVLATFSREFREGMSAEDHRSRILGDTDDSAPSLWHWGGPRSSPHLMLMLYAKDDLSLQRCLAERRAEYGGALREIFVRDTLMLPDRREHFGFADGIAQPSIVGSARNKPFAIKTGEFVLGYPNEYDKIPVSPSVPETLDSGRRLPPFPRNHQEGRDFGKNGTYLVVRQLEQDVEGFWHAMEEYGRGPSGTLDRDQAIRLAAKCVGRWPSGAPLVTSPERDEPKHAKDNDFKYAEADPHGLACPLGSHIRRTNPRDSLEPGPEESLQVVNRHRILRRGRSYGPPLERFVPEVTRNERGLFFVCINTNIRRQFEFIQQTWSNNPKFGGLYEDKDPLIGDQPPGQGGTFTIPELPLRRRLQALARFVRVRGGEYFFLPGLRALRVLGGLETMGRNDEVAC